MQHVKPHLRPTKSDAARWPSPQARIGMTTRHIVGPSLSHVWLFCNPMDRSPPASSARGTFKARILEGAAVSFSDAISTLQLEKHWQKRWDRVGKTEKGCWHVAFQLGPISLSTQLEKVHKCGSGYNRDWKGRDGGILRRYLSSRECGFCHAREGCEGSRRMVRRRATWSHMLWKDHLEGWGVRAGKGESTGKD